MKNTTTFFVWAGLFSLLINACQSPSSPMLFDGKDVSKWHTTGAVSLENGVLTLQGSEAKAVLKKGTYANFDITLEARTTQGGNGYLMFHTDPAMTKGYRVAMHNDTHDAAWWKMTGSLLSVRN